MKRSRYTEEQIVYALKLAESGTAVANVCRKYGISDATFYTWRKKYGGLGVSELHRLRELEAENKRLKQQVADLTMDKRIYRLYCEAELWVRIKRCQKRAAATRGPAPVPSAPGQCWSMDFVTDRLLDGRAFQALTVVDNFSRLSPIIEVAQPMTSRQVIAALERARNQVGLPLAITCDNGSQFTSRRLDAWAYENDVRLDFIRPGKPVENAYIESFNGRFRDECLNSDEFESLEDARRKIEAWRIDYNDYRPLPDGPSTPVMSALSRRPASGPTRLNTPAACVGRQSLG